MKYRVNYEELGLAYDALDQWGVIPYPIAFPNEVSSRVLAAVLPHHDRTLIRNLADKLEDQVWECEPYELGSLVVAWLRGLADEIEDWNPKDDR